MADDELINALMLAYGHGYEPAGPAGDPNSLGYSLQGPAAPTDTSNVLGAMDAQRVAKQRELAQSFTNIATTAAVPYAMLHRAAGNLPKAWELHRAQEIKEGNPFLGPIGYPLNAGVQAGGLGFALNDLAAHGWSTALPELIGPLVTASMMTPHIKSTARILEHLNRTEPKTTTIYGTSAAAPHANSSTQQQDEHQRLISEVLARYGISY